MVKTVPHEALPPLISTPASRTRSEKVEAFSPQASFPRSARAEVVLGGPAVTAESYFRMALDAFRDGESAEAIKALRFGSNALSEAAGVSTLTLAEIAVKAAETRSTYDKK